MTSSDQRGPKANAQELTADTMQWLARLPADLRPAALRAFPHVLNKLAALWADDEACGAYLESLMLDDRGGRQGFPPAALSELIALNLHHHGSIGSPSPRPAQEPDAPKYETVQFTWDDTER